MPVPVAAAAAVGGRTAATTAARGTAGVVGAAEDAALNQGFSQAVMAGSAGGGRAAGAAMGGSLIGQGFQGLGQGAMMARDAISRVEQQTRSPNALVGSVIDRWFPTFVHTVYVVVKGGPESTLRSIWRLCVSAAFGRFRNLINRFAGAVVECNWDITDKVVAIRITYSSSGLVATIAGDITGASAAKVIQDGPREETVGGTWAGFLKTWKQYFDDPNPDVEQPDPNNPNPAPPEVDPEILTDEGRIITSRFKVDPNHQPPRPPEDATMVAMVANALATPCYLPYGPPAGFQVSQPSDEGPERIYGPGTTPPDYTALQAGINSFLNRTFNFGSRDGYAVPVPGSVPPARPDLIPLENPADR